MEQISVIVYDQCIFPHPPYRHRLSLNADATFSDLRRKMIDLLSYQEQSFGFRIYESSKDVEVSDDEKLASFLKGNTVLVHMCRRPGFTDSDFFLLKGGPLPRRRIIVEKIPLNPTPVNTNSVIKFDLERYRHLYYNMNRRCPDWIAFSGLKGSGKDTAGNWAADTRGYVKAHLATPLKRGCQAIFHFEDAQLEDPDLKEKIDPRWGFSPRQAFQIVGTELFRNAFPTFIAPSLLGEGEIWCKSFYIWFSKQIEINPRFKVAVCDVRNPDEELFLQFLGFIVIKVEREGQVSTDGHASETSVKNVKGDIVIHNNGVDRDVYYRQLEEKVGPILDLKDGRWHPSNNNQV